MSDKGYVRKEVIGQLAPPLASVGVLGWLRENLFKNTFNTILTIISSILIYNLIIRVGDFLVYSAVFSGKSGDLCRVQGAGACWIFIFDKFDFLIYGFYPDGEKWRVNLVFLLGVLLLVPLATPQLPYKIMNAVLFFLVYPVVTYYLLNGGIFGLKEVITENWGGLLITLVVAITGIVLSLPIGIFLALGRRSRMPMIRIFCLGFIEMWRAVPLITVLFMASFMIPLFLPEGVVFDKLLRCLIGVTLFSSAYMAEVVRGGLQAIPKGQIEAAQAVGLKYQYIMGLIVLPQALKLVIPGIVNTFIGLFKDTSLVLIVGIFDLLGAAQVITRDGNWLSPVTAITGYVFAASVFWIFCFIMSRYSQFWEARLHTGHKR